MRHPIGFCKACYVRLGGHQPSEDSRIPYYPDMTYKLASSRQKVSSGNPRSPDHRRGSHQTPACSRNLPSAIPSRQRAASGRPERPKMLSTEPRRAIPNARPGRLWLRAVYLSTGSRIPQSRSKGLSGRAYGHHPYQRGNRRLELSVILANNLLKEGVPAGRIAFALGITSDRSASWPVQVNTRRSSSPSALAGAIPFRSAFKTAMDKGKAIIESSSQLCASALMQCAEHHRRSNSRASQRSAMTNLLKPKEQEMVRRHHQQSRL